MKKTLSLMITMCMLLLILPLQMAAADAPEDAAQEATDAAGLLEQAGMKLTDEELDKVKLMDDDLEKVSGGLAPKIFQYTLSN